MPDHNFAVNFRDAGVLCCIHGVTDEMTGIQALERAAPTRPVHPNQVKPQEFEYIRHGTLSLIANWQIAQGGIGQASLGATRTEFDFANHIANTVETAPENTWIFVVSPMPGCTR